MEFAGPAAAESKEDRRGRASNEALIELLLLDCLFSSPSRRASLLGSSRSKIQSPPLSGKGGAVGAAEPHDDDDDVDGIEAMVEE